MQNDVGTLVNIMWGMLGTAGVTFLGLTSYGIKKLIHTVFENTVAIKVLTEKLEDLEKKTEAIPKLEKDVGAAHQKLREVLKKGEI